jgi:hypothetical protein
MILGIDPGPVKSAWATLDGYPMTVAATIAGNSELLDLLRSIDLCSVAIEQVTYQGRRSIGAETLDTVRWETRFASAAQAAGHRVTLIPRNTVRTKLAGPHAGDKEVRAAIIERLGPVGTKRAPGPLWGLKSHEWAALAVALVARDGTR